MKGFEDEIKLNETDERLEYSVEYYMMTMIIIERVNQSDTTSVPVNPSELKKKKKSMRKKTSPGVTVERDSTYGAIVSSANLIMFCAELMIKSTSLTFDPTNSEETKQ